MAGTLFKVVLFGFAAAIISAAPVSAEWIENGVPVVTLPDYQYASRIIPDGFVSLRIYDASGRLVRVLIEEDRSARHYEEVWDGLDSEGHPSASGVYFFRLIAGDFRESRKMVLLR